MLTSWQLEDLPDLGVSSNALSREWRILACYLYSSINLQVIGTTSISIFSYDVNARSRQEMKAWGRRGICSLMPSRRSWSSAYNLNESSWREQKRYNPENSSKESKECLSEQSKISQSCNLRERFNLKYRKQTKFCLIHTCINLILSPLSQSFFVVTDSITTPEQLSSVYKEMTQESQVQLDDGTSSVITSSHPLYRDIWIQPKYQNGNPKRTELSCTEPYCTRYK